MLAGLVEGRIAEKPLSAEQALDIVSRQTGMEWSKLDNLYFVTKR